jgi:hypothetical protein
MARKRLYYYTRLATYNAAVVEIERTLMERKLPKNAAPIARQKVLDMLARFRGEIKFTVVSLNHVARSLNDLWPRRIRNSLPRRVRNRTQYHGYKCRGD